MTVSELQVRVSADTSDAEKGLSSLGTSVTNAGKSLAGVATGAAVAGLAGLAAGLTASVVAAAGFEAQMSAISAVSGATADEMAALSEKALQLGADTSFSASEAAKGMEELIKAGVSVEDVLGGGAAAALSLAAAGGLSVAESAEIASNAMNVFSLKGADVGHVADVIAGAANASAIDVHDFGMSLAASGAVAATVGIGFDDLGTAIAVMGQAGIKGSDAGTSLKTMLLNLTPSTKEQISVAKELGIVTADGANQFFDATGKAKSLAEIAGVLQTATAGLTEQQKLQALQTLFGTDAIRAAAIMAKAGSEGFTEMAASIGKVTAEAVAAERLNNLKGDIEQLTGSLETAGIKIGTAFLPGLRSITQGATDIVNQAAPMLEAFARDSASAIQTASTQIRDAWGTARQAFAGEWLPSDEIPPFVNLVGQAAIKLREFADEGQTVARVLGEMGVAEAFGKALQTVGDEAGRLNTEIRELKGSLDLLHEAFGGTEGEATALGVGLKAVAAAVDIAFLASGELIDVMLSMGRAVVDLTAMVVSAGRALTAFATGDMAGAEAALKSGDAAFADLLATVEDFSTRSTARMTQAMGDVAGVVTSGMGTVKTETTTGMAGAQAATETGMAGVASATETGMATAAASVQANGAAMVGSMTTTGSGMAGAATSGMAQTVGAIEGAAPGGVAAINTMGSGMTSSLQGQAGPMASAGSSVVSGAISAAQGAASGAASIGSAIGSGIQSGILSAAGAIASAAAGVVTRALNAARAAAHIDSPSKVFADQVGEPIVQGIQAGMRHQAPSMERQMTSLVMPPDVTRSWMGGGQASASMQTVRVDVALGGRVAEEIYVTGRDLAIRRGRVPGTSA